MQGAAEQLATAACYAKADGVEGRAASEELFEVPGPFANLQEQGADLARIVIPEEVAEAVGESIVNEVYAALGGVSAKKAA